MAEVDILDEDGRLSDPDGVLARTMPDAVIASVHRMGEYRDLDEYLTLYYRLMLAAIAAPNGAQILGHPWHSAPRLVGKGIVPEWRFEMIPVAMLDGLVDALAASDMALEISSRWVGMFDDPALRAFVRHVRESGVQVAVGSDAHTPDRLDSSLAINRFLAEMGFERDQVWLPERARQRLARSRG